MTAEHPMVGQRRVREVARPPQASLRVASGLGDDFPIVQKLMVRLRDNLLRALRGQPRDALG